MKRILATALGLVVLAVAGLAAARVMFANYLRSDAFRRALETGTARALGAGSAQFAPLEFDGAMAYSDYFRAEREDGGGFSKLDADQLRAVFDWHGLLRHTVQIDELGVARVEADPPNPEAAPAQEGAGGAVPGGGNGWKVDLRKVTINELNWKWSAGEKGGGIEGVGATLIPAGREAWEIEVQGGTLKQAGFPALDVEKARLRWQKPVLYITDGSLREGQGRVGIEGSVETRVRVELHTTLENIDVAPLLEPDWRARLAGRLGGEVRIEQPLGREGAGMRMTGTLAMAEGRLTALPVLDELGVFAKTERFRQVELTRADGAFSSGPHWVDVRNMVVEEEGLLRVEGDWRVRDGMIDGTLQVGVAPDTLQWIPGADEGIFSEPRGGYRWAAMRVSGPASHPEEDLSARLAAAAGDAVLRKAQGTAEKAAEGAVDAARSVLDFLGH